jgi:hypothetical protein
MGDARRTRTKQETRDTRENSEHERNKGERQRNVVQREAAEDRGMAEA